MDDKSALAASQTNSQQTTPPKEKSPGSFKKKLAPAQTGTSGSPEAGSLPKPPK